MKKNVALMLVALMLVNVVLLPSMAQANELRQPKVPPVIESPAILDFLSTRGLSPSHFDADRNLFAYDTSGQLVLITKQALNYIQYGSHAHNVGPDSSICVALTTIYILAAMHIDDIVQIIDICMNIYDLMDYYGIWDAVGTHEPGEPYQPFYPIPHFEIRGGLINWN